MLSISVSMQGAGREGYFLQLSSGGYYATGVEEEGEWFGKGAELLNLTGPVQRDPLRHLLQGFSPDGIQSWV